MFDKGQIFSVHHYHVENLILATNTLYGSQLVPASSKRINVRIVEQVVTPFCPISSYVFLIELADYPLCGSVPMCSDFIFAEV